MHSKHTTAIQSQGQLEGARVESEAKGTSARELQTYFESMLEAKEASITSLQALLAGQRRAAEETAELYEDQRVALKASVTQMGRWELCVCE